MGVIRWEVTEYAGGTVWIGYRGDLAVCDVTSEHSDGTINLLLYPTYPWPEGKGGSYERVACFDAGKAIAEELLQEWLEKADLVTKAYLDDANEAYSGLHKEFLSRIDQALDLAKDLRWSQSEVDRLKRESKHRLDENRDLQAENAVLKERIGAAFGDIDDAITALQKKAASIVDDLGIARTWSWDVPGDEWCKVAKPKQRTEADFRNADIDANGYVTFRDGGAA